MADVTARVIGPALLSGAAATLYTVPAVTTAQIVHLHVFNNDTAAVTFTLSIGADAAGTRLFDAVSIPAKSVLCETGVIVAAAGEIIQGFAGTANKLNISAHAVLTT